MSVKDVYIRPLGPEDWRLIDAWRRQYTKGDLEYPHGLQMAGVETAIATKSHRPISSLTAIQGVILDPFAHDPTADPFDLSFSLVKLETALVYKAQQGGAVDAYIAVPVQEEAYIKLLDKHGYRVTAQHCVVMRKPLVPDHVPLLGEERDRQEREAREAQEAAEPVKELRTYRFECSRCGRVFEDVDAHQARTNALQCNHPAWNVT